MSFRVYSSVVNGNTLVHLSDNNHSTRVTVIPEAGAMLHAFTIPVNDEPFNVIENYSLDGPVKEQVTHYFRSVKLSPWVCRLAGGHYQFNDKTFQIQRMYSDGTALHGLLFDATFEVTDEFAGETSAGASLRHHYKGDDKGYPFEYICEVKYTLHSQGMLRVDTTVINPGPESIPVADGWHPYFKLGGKVDNWELQFNGDAMLEFDDRLIPTGKLLPYHKFIRPAAIGQTVMDNCFLLNMHEGDPACTLRNPANNITVSFYPDTAYPYLQIFIPDHRESIAVENISSAPDSFNNGMGLVVLPAGNSRTFSVTYKVGA